jgi:hypothetical protein
MAKPENYHESVRLIICSAKHHIINLTRLFESRESRTIHLPKK